jgi:hypothetical protein
VLYARQRIVEISIERIQTVRYSIVMRASVAFLALGTPAFAFGLTDSDLDYLTTQNVPRESSVLHGLSPKEQARLHAIIIDSAGGKDPSARARNVAEAIAEYQGHQLWEQAHPGQLWDSPQR